MAARTTERSPRRSPQRSPRRSPQRSPQRAPAPARAETQGKTPPRALAGLALLLGGALLWAYLVTHPFGQAPPAGQVQVWKAEARQLRKLTLKNDTIQVTLEPQWTERENPYVWISTEQERKSPRGKGRPEPEKKKLIRMFKGNSKAEKAVAFWAALPAVRAIGGVDMLDKAAFGFDKPQGTVRVELEGEAEPFELVLGATTYGKRMRYALFKEDETVYLFRQSRFTDLIRATTTLLDRALFPFSPNLAERIKVIHEGTEREFHRRKGAEPGEPAWGEGPDDPEGNPAFQGFLSGLNRLKVVEYPADQAAQDAENAVPVLEVRLFLKSRPESPQKSQGAAPEGAWLKLFPSEKKGIVARASHTRKWVRVSARMGKNLLRAAGKIMEEAARQEKPTGQKG